MRVLRSLLSIFLVTTLTYTIIYTMVPRNWFSSRIPTTTRLQRLQISGIIMRIPFMNVWAILSITIPRSCKEKANTMDSSVTVDANDTNKAIYEKYINQLGNGWTLGVFSESGQFYATREIPIFWTCFQILCELTWYWSYKRFKTLKIQTGTLSSFWKWPCYRLVIGWFRYQT